MLLGLIVLCEVMFWLVLLAGLITRYLLRRPRLGLLLLGCAPLVDLVLLAAATLDLRHGGRAGTAHALAAVYIGSSVGFGSSMVRWADDRFAYHVAGGPRPERRYGAEHAAHERVMWLRHVLAWAVGCALLGLATLMVGDLERAGALLHVAAVWTAVLVVDFVVSFSYTLFPRRSRRPATSEAGDGG